MVHTRSGCELYLINGHSSSSRDGGYLLETDPQFTKGQFFAFLLYANMFYEPIRQLVGINNLVAAGKASGERVFEIMDAPIEIINSESPRPFPIQSHEIKFDKVSFSYSEKSYC